MFELYRPNSTYSNTVMASAPTLCELVTSVVACDYLSTTDLATIANACEAEASRRARHARETVAAWHALTPEQQQRIGDTFAKMGEVAATTLRAHIEAVNRVIIAMAGGLTTTVSYSELATGMTPPVDDDKDDAADDDDATPIVVAAD